MMRTIDERNKLVEDHLDLVEFIVKRMKSKLPSFVDIEDLRGAAYFGIIDAAEKFDDTRGVKFRTYAEFRIKGSIIDELRKLDEVPRREREETKIVDVIISELQSELMREPTTEEIADRLDGVAPKDRIQVFSYDSLETTDTVTELSIEDNLDDLLNKDHLDSLMPIINQIGEKERFALVEHFLNERTHNEIKDNLGVCESRISQLIVKAIKDIRLKIGVDVNKEIPRFSNKRENKDKRKLETIDAPYYRKKHKLYHSKGRKPSDIIIMRYASEHYKLPNWYIAEFFHVYPESLTDILKNRWWSNLPPAGLFDLENNQKIKALLGGWDKAKAEKEKYISLRHSSLDIHTLVNIKYAYLLGITNFRFLSRYFDIGYTVVKLFFYGKRYSWFDESEYVPDYDMLSDMLFKFIVYTKAEYLKRKLRAYHRRGKQLPHNATLSDQEIKEIRGLIAIGIQQSTIAKYYRLFDTTVMRIKQNRLYVRVKGKIGFDEACIIALKMQAVLKRITQTGTYGDRNAMFDDFIVREIRIKRRAGFTLGDLKQEYGLDKSCLSELCKHKTYKHITWP